MEMSIRNVKYKCQLQMSTIHVFLLQGGDIVGNKQFNSFPQFSTVTPQYNKKSVKFAQGLDFLKFL